MRVEFREHDDDFYEAKKAAVRAVDDYFLSRVVHQNHPSVTYKSAIDGVPLSRNAGFPKMNGSSSNLMDVMRSFISMRTEMMNTVLRLRLEYNGDQPLSIGGSFFVRTISGCDTFLEINFREELDGTCIEPMQLICFEKPEHFSIEHIIMSGQRKLSMGREEFATEYKPMSKEALANALLSEQSFYRWEAKEGDSIEKWRCELAVRAARLKLAAVKSGFPITHGALGPKLKQLAEQYLV